MRKAFPGIDNLWDTIKLEKLLKRQSFLLFVTGGKKSRFAVGHLTLAYTLSKVSAKFLKTRVNVPLVLALSIISDVDIIVKLFLPFIQHRGATHSIIVTFLIFIPFFVFYRKKAIPYFLALLSHFLFADFIAGGRIQLFWPLSFQHYGLGISIRSPTNIILEWMLFLVAMIVMLKTNDIAIFFKPLKSNLILVIVLPTLLLPLMLSFQVPPFLGFTLDAPVMLILPHLILSFLLSTAIFISALEIFKKDAGCCLNSHF